MLNGETVTNVLINKHGSAQIAYDLMLDVVSVCLSKALVVL
jgi:hypothetical protein